MMLIIFCVCLMIYGFFICIKGSDWIEFAVVDRSIDVLMAVHQLELLWPFPCSSQGDQYQAVV